MKVLANIRIFSPRNKLVQEKNVFLMSRMPCPVTGPKTFYAGPNFLSQPKNLTAFRASSKTFVPAQNVRECHNM